MECFKRTPRALFTQYTLKTIVLRSNWKNGWHIIHWCICANDSLYISLYNCSIDDEEIQQPKHCFCYSKTLRNVLKYSLAFQTDWTEHMAVNCLNRFRQQSTHILYIHRRIRFLQRVTTLSYQLLWWATQIQIATTPKLTKIENEIESQIEMQTEHTHTP